MEILISNPNFDSISDPNLHLEFSSRELMKFFIWNKILYLEQNFSVLAKFCIRNKISSLKQNFAFE